MAAPALRSLQADEFGALPPLAQWNLLESSFRDLRLPGLGAFAPMLFIMAIQLMTGQLWCLGWLVTALAGVALSRHVAEQFDTRPADATVSFWAGRYSVAVWWQAMALGAGGFAAAWDCHPMTAVMVAGLLGFAIMQVCGTALLAQATRIQLLALAAPLAVTCVTQGLLRHGGMEEAAVGGVFAVWAAGAVPIADRSAARVKQLALAIADECQVASSRGRDVVVAPDVENFQRLLGRDQATGLPNRLSFARLLEQESARASRAEAPLSLILLGWDDYEKYVAWRTPQALDARLADIAKRLRATLRRQADMLGSLGVGRFGVILPATDAFGATIVARNMQEALGKPEADMPGGVAAAPLRASIGAASYRGKGPLPDTQLLEFAEAALRDARNAGGNRIRRYDPAVMALQPAAAKTKVNQDTPQDRDDTARPSLVAAITKDILGL